MINVDCIVEEEEGRLVTFKVLATFDDDEKVEELLMKIRQNDRVDRGNNIRCS